MEIIHHHFESLPSTNDWAKEHLASFDRDKMTLITASRQTHGRGQYGKKWQTPEAGDSLCCTYAFFVRENQGEPLSLTHLLALSLQTVLKEKGVKATIKKPNDLLVNGKKIAGILCETQSLDPYTAVVMGIGININVSDSFLRAIDQPATALSIELKRREDPLQILSRLTTLFIQKLKSSPASSTNQSPD